MRMSDRYYDRDLEPHLPAWLNLTPAEAVSHPMLLAGGHPTLTGQIPCPCSLPILFALVSSVS